MSSATCNNLLEELPSPSKDRICSTTGEACHRRIRTNKIEFSGEDTGSCTIIVNAAGKGVALHTDSALSMKTGISLPCMSEVGSNCVILNHMSDVVYKQVAF